MAHVSNGWRGAARLARDFAFGLMLFWGATLALCTVHSQAYAFHLPNAQAASYENGAARLLKTERASYYTTVAVGPLRELNPTQLSAPSKTVALGMLFALMTMLNLAFLRHVRRVAKVPARNRR